MSKPKTLLEDLCEHALSCGAQSIEVEYKDGREWVFARKGETAFGTANFESSSRDAKELRENLYAARKKSVRTAIGDRKSTRLNSSHSQISYAVFCLKKKKKQT